MKALSLLRIGVDLDGVLNDLTSTILGRLKARGLCPENFGRDQIRHYEFEKCIPGVTGEHIWDLLRDGDVFWQAPPDATAREVLTQLDEDGAQVHIVTSRDFSQLHREMTEEWLRKHQFPYHRLAIYNKRNKPLYAAANQLDLFIEDHLGTAVAMTEVCRAAILLDKPYNRWEFVDGVFDAPEPEPVNLLRMYSWHEISKFFLGY